MINKLIVIAVISICYSACIFAEEARKAVLVTGASSGIGLKITEVLAAEGYWVYAGARKPADLDRLDAMENVEAVRLDVTYPEDIAAAVTRVSDAGRGLYAIVNNAGVAMIGPLIETDIEELEFVFDVNVYGPYRITQAFAPLVLEAQGRVINISSISGVLSPGLFGHYSMSKHALEAYTDSLAAELVPLGVQVSAIEPGNYNSDIGRTVMKRLENGALDIENSRYADRLRAIAERGADRSVYKEPDEVAAAVLDALSAPNPKRRYMVTPDARSAEITIRKAIEELVQLNEDQPYSYARDDLVQLLDETLQRSRLARAAD
ncbi:MAG: SDR family oxidoreductase [Woeseia sp.]|nr:SDR family oxidoreductase [Woeseia sp.]